MTNKILNIFILGIAIVFNIACDKSTVKGGDANANLRAVTLLNGTASDGYLQGSTVCIDLNQDGECSSDTEPTALTDSNGTFKLNVTTSHKSNVNYSKASLIVYGGVDKDTGTAFKGLLKSIKKDNVNITPISTLIESSVKDNNKTEEEAKTLVRKIFELSDDFDLDVDPIKLAETNSTLFKTSMKIHKTIEIISNKQERGEDERDDMTSIYSQISNLVSTTSTTSITFITLIQNIGRVKTDSLVKEKIKISIENIDKIETILTTIAIKRILIIIQIINNQNSIDELRWNRIKYNTN